MSNAPTPKIKTPKGIEIWSNYKKGSADHPLDLYGLAPNEMPVCCDDTPKEVDRFDPEWKNGNTYECGKCGTRWCNCSKSP